MENEHEEIIDSTNDAETTENEEVVDETTEAEESVDELKKKVQTLQAQKEHWRKKAERPAGGEKETPESNKGSGYSIKDAVALGKINLDDIDDVVQAAKVLNIPIHQAVNHNVVKTLLAEKEEKRTSANATNVRNASRGASQVSEDRLLADAQSGKFPEKDEDIQRLLKARMNQK